MAAATSVSIQTKITGEELVTHLTHTKSFSLEEKLELDISLSNTSKTIDFSDISNPQAFLFTCTEKIKVIITASSQVIEFEIEGIFLFNPTSAFVSLIDSIVVQNTETTAKTIKIRVYGKPSS
jgi:hypothetical protein